MSGGSYNYVCYADPGDLLQKHGQDLQEMVGALSRAGADDAARETETVIAILDHFRNRMQARLDRLNGVWRAMEWWHSGDISEEDFKKALAEYRSDVEPA
jgi:hypothetical protein